MKRLRSAGEVHDERVTQTDAVLRLAREPPLKRYLATPRLKEDLAKCALAGRWCLA